LISRFHFVKFKITCSNVVIKLHKSSNIPGLVSGLPVGGNKHLKFTHKKNIAYFRVPGQLKTDRMNKIFFSTIFFLFLACNDQTKQNREKHSSVNERSFIKLGGEDQYVEITGASDKDPVLLFLHGGPGWPQTPHLRYFNSDLTKSMIVVAWEQSGCGKSFMNNPDPKNLSPEQIINDAHELTLLLKKKFKQNKIYLAGFSWGSVIGLQLVKKYPEDYAAYFAISQVIDINRSIDLSRKWLQQQAELRKDKRMLKFAGQLKQKDTSLCKTTLECFFKKYELLTEYGGAIYKKESEAQIKIAETSYEDYKNYDWIKGFMFSCSRMEDYVFKINLSDITELKVPAYFFVGRHDWNLPSIVTEEFVSKLNAPVKEIIWFEESGHEPLDEEPAKFNKALIERISN
jgi:proline iminopeptidase